MYGEPCSPAWRTSALLLGASWVVTLAVACGGGGDDVVATPLSTAAQSSGDRIEAGATATAALPLRTAAQVPDSAPERGPANRPAPLLPPCSDKSLQPAHSAAVPAHLRAPRVQGDKLDDEALESPAGRHGSGASGTDPLADPFEAK